MLGARQRKSGDLGRDVLSGNEWVGLTAVEEIVGAAPNGK